MGAYRIVFIARQKEEKIYSVEVIIRPEPVSSIMDTADSIMMILTKQLPVRRQDEP
jgi:hypothetical protein